MKRSVLFLMMSVAVAMAVIAQDKESKATKEQHQLFTPAELQWGDGPKGLPPGAKLAVLSGNPKEAGPFTMRLQFPADYKIMPHTHPSAEHVTVISGKMNLGMGEKFDQSASKEMLPGSFGVMPPGMTHFAWASEPTVVQVHGTGPFEIKYVNPADDPRGEKK